MQEGSQFDCRAYNQAAVMPRACRRWAGHFFNVQTARGMSSASVHVKMSWLSSERECLARPTAPTIEAGRC